MEYVTVQGVEVPALGFGTAGMDGETTRRAVESALELGYRHLDTAQMYGNEAAVGAAIEASDVDRGEVFVVTKIHRRNLAYDDVLDSFAGSLDRLATGYVDLLLIHAPSRTVPVEESIRAMNELQDEGTVRHVGVSNFSVDRLAEAVAASGTPILTNQVEYHPFADRHELLAYCIERDVLVTAYSPLNRGRRLDHETLVEIGRRHGKTPAQVALRWLLQQDHVAAIPKAASREHRAENLDVFDFALSDEEMRAIFALQAGPLDRIRDVLGL